MSPSRLPFLAALAVLSLACGGDGPPPGDEGLNDDLARERAAALYIEDKFAEAVALLTPLAERPDATLDDVLRLALATFDDTRSPPDRTWELVQRMTQMAPDDARVSFFRGRLLLNDRGEPELAAEAFRLAVARHPDDLWCRVWLGEALQQLGQIDEAAEQYRVVQAAGLEVGQELYLSAIYKLGQMLIRQGQTDAGMALLDEKHAIEEPKQSIKAASSRQLERGPLLAFSEPPRRAGRIDAPSVPLGAFTEVVVAPLAAAEHVLSVDVDDDGRIDLLSWGPAGVAVSLQQADGSFAAPVATEGPGHLVAATVADLEKDPALGGTRELITIERADNGADLVRVWAFLPDRGAWEPWREGLLAVVDPVDVEVCDLDHDGDLDLLVPTRTSGLRLLRNDGEGGVVDATPEAAASLVGCRSVLPEDIDGDNDVDLLVRTAQSVELLSNERGGRFRNASEEWAVPAVQDAFTATDLDADGRPDLVWTSSNVLQWSRFDGQAFGAPQALAVTVQAPWSLHDVNLDTYPDVVTYRSDPGELVAHLGPLTGGAPQAASLLDAPPLIRDFPTQLDDRLVVADILGVEPDAPLTPTGEPTRPGGDGRLELAVARADGVALYRREPVNAFSLELIGVKDNGAGTGSIVEVRVGERYQRTYWRGQRVALGLGDGELASFVRVTWPNGVVQHVFDVAPGDTIALGQVDRFAGSCPFLYTWNGERFVFVTDVLGTTPLGLPMGPGQLVPFDHEEYVKVRGDQLAPDADGMLRMAVTEELREVTYLDRVRLHVIDHPVESEIQPDEAFVMPPFPPHHVHTLTEVLPPASALANRAAVGPGGYGSRDRSEAGLDVGDDELPVAQASSREPRGAPVQDVTELITHLDERHARPFQPLPRQLQGLTEPWSLDLTFGRTPAERAAIRDAPRLRLALTGWFRWGDASVNMVAARHPEHEFAPPVLWVPAKNANGDGADGWRPLGPPIGFPAGKTKTMIVDLTDALDRDDPRLRMTTTLELSWDAVRLVIDGDDAPTRETVLEAQLADLRFRGFSTLLETGRDDWPELFDWDVLTENVPWNQHMGPYTRYGDVLPLLGDVDDRYVIFGAGDTIDLAFDGSDLPALPEGWTRSYLVYFDGWAKDGDPNTLAAQHVLPLPFHGMSSYPPPEGERFPDTPAHRAWALEWNTRAGRRLMPSLVPGEDELALAAWQCVEGRR